MWRQFRPILGLQVLSTAAATLLSAWLAGKHGAISAALGGLIGIMAGLVFAVLASRGSKSGKSESAGRALYAALRAEAVKVALMFIPLWLVLATYKDVVAASLIGSFIATVAIFAMAVLVRDA